jgi:outer membrane biosynthesis protein TonB
MTEKAERKIAPAQIGLGALMIVVLGAGVYIVKTILSEDVKQRKSAVATVTLLKPPPVTVKEKPLEPEPIKNIQKKEEIIDTVQNNEPKSADNDATPAGDQLGLDAEGAAGGDGFGLVGRKGGRSLLAGGDGMGRISLLSKFASYTQIVSNQIKKKIMKRLDDEGGIPKGKLEAIVRVSVDSDGAIVDYKIIGSSGNHRMDEAVKLTLPHIKIGEPPPDGMPRTMNIKITSQG